MNQQAEAIPNVESDLGRELGTLLRAYRDRVTPLLEAFPKGTRGYQTLVEVVGGAHSSQLALANHLGIDRTMMTYLIDDLERAGFVERLFNPSDRRQRSVVATDKGIQAVAETCQQVRRQEDLALGLLSEEERSLFRSLLRKSTAPAEKIGQDACETAGHRIS